MKMNYTAFITLCTLLSSGVAFAQVGISKDTNFTPDLKSILDVSSSDQGILIPRVALEATNVTNPISSTGTTPNSLLVYNTATAGASPDNVTPGFYYWLTDKWVRLTNQNDIDLRLVGTNNHITKDAGFGGTGTSAGTGSDNIAIGKDVLKSILDYTSASNSRKNIGVGTNSLNNLTRGHNNIALGYNAVSAITTGFSNIGIGSNSLESNRTNYGNTAVGFESLQKMANGLSSVNTAIGYQSMKNLVEGTNNVAIGNGAMRGNSDSGATELGVSTNKNNIAIGSVSLVRIHSGEQNIAIGENALDHNVSGSRNVGIGAFNGVELSSGSNNTFIGSYSGTSTGVTSTNYATAIGADAKVGASHSIVLGRTGTTNTSRDKIGIGVISPTHVLHVKENVLNTDPVKIEGLNEDPTAANVVVVGTDGVLKTVAKTTVSSTSEPWLVQGGTSQANSNTQNIYQMGKVAIGAGATALTGSQADAKLFVSGDIETSGRIFSANSVFADYVFEKYYTGTSTLNNQYDFKSLKYVKEFTEKNHHLPGVTSIKEIKKSDNGYVFDLSELSIQQLEKIEELYLHTIQQQELIDKQNQEIETLKESQKNIEERLNKLEKLLK